MLSVRGLGTILVLASFAPAGGASSGAAVGLRVLPGDDGARNGRPLQVVIWYPAASEGSGGSSPALSQRDYLALSLVERGARTLAASEIDAETAKFAAMFASPEAIAAAKRWLTAPGAAVRDAQPAAGRFPLVLVAQGNGQSAFDQAPLAEALAARGYVVATTPSPMRVDGPMQSADEIGARAQVQAEDLAWAATRISRDLPVDHERLAVVGHSFGARAALLFAMHEPQVRALVSLDGGIGAALGREAMERAPWFSADGTRAAILHFYEELDPFMTPDFTLLRAVARSGLELVPTVGMHHHHFTNLGFAAAAEPELARASGAGAELPAQLALLCDRLYAFLDRQLADPAASRTLGGSSPPAFETADATAAPPSPKPSGSAPCRAHR